MTRTSKALGLAAGIASIFVFATQAAAVDARVRSACMSDYFAYCSQHDPDGPGVRQCMRANGPKLSKGCLNALVAAGEVSKAEVTKKASK
jgi:hypothetical protein